MLLALTTARFLLLFLFLALTLSTPAYLLQGRQCSLVVSQRKVIENEIRGRKMEMMKENSQRSSIYSRKSRMLMRRENYRDRFVAFNADYKGPRHHPPKNN